MMRIALVMPYDLAYPGGVRTHTLALTSWLRDRGCDAQVIAPSSDASAASEAWIHGMGSPLRVPIGGSVGNIALSPRGLQRLRWLLSEDWDIIHIQEPAVPLLGPLALRAAPQRAATVLTFHSAEQTGARLYCAAAPLLRGWLARADACIAVSTAALATAQPILGGPARLIPPCIEPIAARAPRLLQPNSAPSVLFVGRDEPRKGLPTLLRAFARLETEEATLRVAGPVRTESRRLAQRLGIAHRLQFLGATNAAGVRRLLSQSALLCAPALGGEALGLVLVEAMAAGVPVAASDIDGYRIAARRGRAALLAPPGDPAALASAIDRALSDTALRERLIAAGRASARRFDVSTVGAEHLRLYRRLTFVSGACVTRA